MENGGKMENPGEIYQLCRLCLANNQVNVPIFGEKSDIRQISLKISSCLPVVIAVDDLLPKNICEGCSDKLELFYAFWNSSQEADKTLRAWMEEININNASETISAVVKKIANSEEIPLIAEVKEETEDFAGDGQNKTIFNQQPFDDDEDVDEKESEEAPPSKRARLSPTVEENISINQESDDDDNEEYDVDEVEPKVEDESDMSDSEDDEPLSSIADRTGTSVDEPQAGPSGVGKDGAEAPFLEAESMTIKEEVLDISDIDESELFPDISCFTQSNIEETKTKKYEYDIIMRLPLRRNHICEVCSKGFITAPVLRSHMFTHSEERKFECAICGAKFKMKAGLSRHLKACYAPKDQKKGYLMKRNHICELCSKGFFTVTHLRDHIITHSKKRNFKCAICGAKYKWKISLSRHLKTCYGPKYLKG